MPAPSLIGRIAGALAARQAISECLVEMGEPAAGLFETLDALRARYRDAIERANDEDREHGRDE